MDLSVVAVVASIAAGVAILVAVAAVLAARRSTAHADLALKEASRISRASISRINEVQSEASSARLAARHAAERLRSMTKERTTPDSVAAYRVFLREVVEDSKHLLGPESTGTLKNEALDRLRVGALVGGSDEVLRALRNFALLRTQRPEAPWPSAYAMAYARLESDLVTAIRNDLGSSEESLTADQIWGAVNARCVDPAFRLALLSPLEDVLRNAGQDPAHYDLDHVARFADYPAPNEPIGSAGPASTPRTAGAVTETPRRRSRRAQSRVAREAATAARTMTGSPTGSPAGAPAAGTALPDSSGIVWAPLTPGRRGSHVAAGEVSAVTSAAASAVSHSTSPTSHRSPEAQRPVLEDPTPSRISRRRRSQASQASQADPSTQAAATAPEAVRAASTAAPAAVPSMPSSTPASGTSVTTSTTSAISATSATVQDTGTSTSSANTEETEPVFAPAFPEALTRGRAAEPHAPAASGTSATSAPPVASGAPSATAPAQREPAQPQPRPTRTRTSSPSTPPTVSPPRATAVAAQTVTVPTGPQQSVASAASAASVASAASTAPAVSAPAARAARTDGHPDVYADVYTGGYTGGYGVMPPQGEAQAPAQTPGNAGPPVPDPSVPLTPEPAEQSSAVAVAGAVPASTVGAHRAVAVPARTAAPAGLSPATDPSVQETVTVPTGPPVSAPSTTHAAAPTSAAWSFTPPSLQDSAELPRARGA